MGAYEQILAVLPSLTGEQRAAVAYRLKALDSLSGGAATAGPSINRPLRSIAVSSDDFIDDIFSAVCEVVLARSGERVSPLALRRTAQSNALRGKVDALRVFINTAASSRTARRGLLAIAMRLLYDDLRELGLPTTARTLLAHAHRLPAVLDANFPGYAAAGLLGMLVGRRRIAASIANYEGDEIVRA